MGRTVFAARTRFWARLLAAQTSIAAQMAGPVLRLGRQPLGIWESPLRWTVRHEQPVIYLQSDASALRVGIWNVPVDSSSESESDLSLTASFRGVEEWEDDDWEL